MSYSMNRMIASIFALVTNLALTACGMDGDDKSKPSEPVNPALSEASPVQKPGWPVDKLVHRRFEQADAWSARCGEINSTTYLANIDKLAKKFGQYDISLEYSVAPAANVTPWPGERYDGKKSDEMKASGSDLVFYTVGNPNILVDAYYFGDGAYQAAVDALVDAHIRYKESQVASGASGVQLIDAAFSAIFGQPAVSSQNFCLIKKEFVPPTTWHVDAIEALTARYTECTTSPSAAGCDNGAMSSAQAAVTILQAALVPYQAARLDVMSGKADPSSIDYSSSVEPTNPTFSN